MPETFLSLSVTDIDCSQSPFFAKVYRDRGLLSWAYCILLFRKRLSEKVHTTIPKGIVDGFEITVLHRNLKEWHERPWTMFPSAKAKQQK